MASSLFPHRGGPKAFEIYGLIQEARIRVLVNLPFPESSERRRNLV
jgi:hypothetical protein